MATRHEQFKKIFSSLPAFRTQQMSEAIFHSDWKSWKDASVFPKDMREKMDADIPWLSYAHAKVLAGKKRDAYKAALELLDGEKIETVLMENSKGSWTICMSSQIGCPMGCVFCATGTMGLKRNLTQDEIIDQYRFWADFLRGKKISGNITNIVLMGMGEPLLNYKDVKEALNAILENTQIGETHIAVSTVGILEALELILSDREWPRVLIAISLHSADPDIRKKIVPLSSENSLDDIAQWSKKYIKKFGNRSHCLMYEYVMLKGVNDSVLDAKKLVKFVTTTGNIKVNLIPYNQTGTEYESSSDEAINVFFEYLKKHRVMATVRKSLGSDISAACGQLATR